MVRSGRPQLYPEMGGDVYVDLAVDENGLWAIMAMRENNNTHLHFLLCHKCDASFPFHRHRRKPATFDCLMCILYKAGIAQSTRGSERARRSVEHQKPVCSKRQKGRTTSDAAEPAPKRCAREQAAPSPRQETPTPPHAPIW